MKYTKKLSWSKIEELNYTNEFMQSVEADVMWRANNSTIPGYYGDDLAQELRMQIYTKLHRYNPERASFRNWANQVMKNRLLDMYRRTKYKNRDVLDDTDTVFIEPK